jgi:hypothetical protein
MRVLLDEQPWESTATTIGDTIAAAAAEARSRGRVVVEVVVDGVPWGEAQLASPESCSGAADELRLVTNDLAGLVRATLSEGATALVDADLLQREAAEDLQAGRTTEAMTRLGAALAIWDSVQEAVSRSAEAFDLDLDTLDVGGAKVADRVETLKRHLDAVQRALESKDPVGLSDTLLYDLPEVVGEWREMLETITSTLAAPTGVAK